MEGDQQYALLKHAPEYKWAKQPKREREEDIYVRIRHEMLHNTAKVETDTLENLLTRYRDAQPPADIVFTTMINNVLEKITREKNKDHFTRSYLLHLVAELMNPEINRM